MTFKLLLLGDGGVGKTSLAERYIRGVFVDSSITVGVDFYTKALDVDGKRINLQIWDFAGEDRFRFLLPGYSKGASGALFLYSITSPETMAHANEWLDVVFKNAGPIPVLLVGAKSDLGPFRKVQPGEAVQFAQVRNLAGFVEVSAKDGTNVEKTFEAITKLMMERAAFEK